MDAVDEYVGRVATATEGVSVARMIAPGGWAEPAQAPDFVAVCLPAFAPDLAHRD